MTEKRLMMTELENVHLDFIVLGHINAHHYSGKAVGIELLELNGVTPRMRRQSTSPKPLCFLQKRGLKRTPKDRLSVIQ